MITTHTPSGSEHTSHSNTPGLGSAKVGPVGLPIRGDGSCINHAFAPSRGGGGLVSVHPRAYQSLGK